MADGWNYIIEHAGQQHALENRQMTVGRSRKCDISVPDPSVSRKHVYLTAGDGQVVLQELGSSNGTFLDGERVEGSRIVTRSGTLELGDAVLQIIIAAQAPEVAPPMGEATSFLQAASVRLAQEAMVQEAEMTPPQAPTAPSGPWAAAEPPLPPPPADPGNVTTRLDPSQLGASPAAGAGGQVTTRLDVAQMSELADGAGMATTRLDPSQLEGVAPVSQTADSRPADSQAADSQAADSRPADNRPADSRPAEGSPVGSGGPEKPADVGMATTRLDPSQLGFGSAAGDGKDQAPTTAAEAQAAAAPAGTGMATTRLDTSRLVAEAENSFKWPASQDMATQRFDPSQLAPAPPSPAVEPPAPVPPPPPAVLEGDRPVVAVDARPTELPSLAAPLLDDALPSGPPAMPESFAIPTTGAAEVKATAPSFEATPPFEAPPSLDAGPASEAAAMPEPAVPSFEAPPSFDALPSFEAASSFDPPAAPEPPPSFDDSPSFDAAPSFDSPPSFEPAAPLSNPSPAGEASQDGGVLSFGGLMDESLGGYKPSPEFAAETSQAPPSADPPSSGAASFDAPPSFDAPSSFDAPPTFDAPPSFDAPPTFEAAPSVEAPSFEPPTFEEAPSVEAPSFEAPSFEPPSFEPPAPQAAATSVPDALEPPEVPAVPIGATRLDDAMPAMPPSTSPPAVAPAAKAGVSSPPLEFPDLSATGAGMTDIRNLGLPSGAADSDSNELLPSLDGFDTTLGPGVAVPESFERAHQSVVARQSEVTEEVPLAAAQYNPYQHTGGAEPPRAGFWIRALAVILDGVWMFGLSASAAILFPDQWMVPAAVSAFNMLVVLVGWSVWGQTPGKRLVGIYICTKEGKPGIGFLRALSRMAAYLVSILLLGIGFLLALGENKLALHDRLVGTFVRRRR